MYNHWTHMSEFAKLHIQAAIRTAETERAIAEANREKLPVIITPILALYSASYLLDCYNNRLMKKTEGDKALRFDSLKIT